MATQANDDAKTKFFLVMPLTDGFTGSEGIPEAPFPKLEYCRIFYDSEGAEKGLLAAQKNDPEGVYVLLESTDFCENFIGTNEWRIAKTKRWW